MISNIPRIVIAAPSSGSGKSTIAAGLMKALSSQYTVQTFKVGPDYIDPGYHAAATGRVSRNLDTWLVPKGEVLNTFGRASRKADLAIIEGVMGLYDGYGADTEDGSTAQLAKFIKAPVILVLDVGKMARSAGALALGYIDYDSELTIAGVICNRVGSAAHAQWVTRAIEDIGLPVFGCIPESAQLHIPERHLGLHMAIECRGEVETFLHHAESIVREHIDLERIVQAASHAQPIYFEETQRPKIEKSGRLAVARDEAFCFYYEDNLDHLRAAGAEIVFFSPLEDISLPEDIAGIYIGGGYPELYATALEKNDAMRQSIRQAHRDSMPIYAECGGLMYLTESISDLQGKTYEMVGLLPGRSSMQERLIMGYRQVTALNDSLLLNAGKKARGHEFHYSIWQHPEEIRSTAYQLTPRKGVASTSEGHVDGNLLASYVHLHFGSNTNLAGNFVARCLDLAGE